MVTIFTVSHLTGVVLEFLAWCKLRETLEGHAVTHRLEQILRPSGDLSWVGQRTPRHVREQVFIEMGGCPP